MSASLEPELARVASMIGVPSRRRCCRRCWAMLAAMLERRWLARIESTRALRLTVCGRDGLYRALGLELASRSDECLFGACWPSRAHSRRSMSVIGD